MTNNNVSEIYEALQRSFLTKPKKGKGAEDLPGAKSSASLKEVRGLGKAEKSPKDADGFKEPEEEKNKLKMKKTVKEGINTGMSMKNLFDRLYEEVMEDDEAVLGIGGDSDFGDDMGDDMDEDMGDEITVSLPRDVAQQLCDALNALLGDEGEDEGEDDMEFGDDMGEDEGSPFPEGVEFQKAPDGVSKLTGKANKVGNLPTSSGGGSGDYTDKVGEDGDLGHSGVNPKKGHGGKADHSNMKVKARRPGAPGSHAFGN